MTSCCNFFLFVLQLTFAELITNALYIYHFLFSVCYQVLQTKIAILNESRIVAATIFQLHLPAGGKVLIPETPDYKVGSTVFNYNRCHKSIGTTCIGESPDVKSKSYFYLPSVYHTIILSVPILFIDTKNNI